MNWPEDTAWGLAGARVEPPPPDHDTFTSTPLLTLLLDAAERHAGEPALVGRTEALTFGELPPLIHRAAHAIASLVPAGRPVACLLPCTPTAMVALLGCMVAGRVALILDPAWPVRRLMALLEDAAPAALLTDAAPPFPYAAPVLLSRDALAGSDRPWRPDRDWDPDAPFAVHYTSGSTGRPKGIVLSARSALYRGLDNMAHSGLAGDDRVYSSATHVGSNGAAVMLAGLAKGARVVVGGVATDGAGGLLRLLEREGVTAASFAQPVLRLMFQLPRAAAAFSALRVLRIGAGAQPAGELPAWREMLPRDCVVHHTYASTEALVMAQWDVPRDHSLDQTTLAAGMIQRCHDYAIVGEDGRAVPFGDAGELVVRSRYLALGEWRDGGVVPGRMSPVADRPGWRMFRTGDLVRVQHDGMLRVVGRADRQVKINGVRVEPSEIESVLRAETGVTESAVVIRRDGAATALHAFVAAANANRSALAAALRARLNASLPTVSRPSRVIILDQLPMLPGGKIDLVALGQWQLD